MDVEQKWMEKNPYKLQWLSEDEAKGRWTADMSYVRENRWTFDSPELPHLNIL